MGTDNLFHKNRFRRENKIKRKAALRSRYKLILIVSEGKETEPNYFTALRNDLRLNKESVVISRDSKGNDPLSLVNTAEAKNAEECKNNPEKRGYDRVFIVFDRDTHTTYNAALKKMEALNKKYSNVFEGITSVPCFEFWLLIHFEDTTRPYIAIGDKSAGDRVTHDLKKYIPDYYEGHKKIFEITQPHLDTAIRRAELLEKRNEETNTDNPSTKVHKLVGYMRELEKR